MMRISDCALTIWGAQYSCKHVHFLTMLFREKVCTQRSRSVHPAMPPIDFQQTTSASNSASTSLTDQQDVMVIDEFQQ